MTFTVIGSFDRASAGGSSSSSSGSSGGSSSSSSPDMTTTVANLVFQITYNPLLNTLKVVAGNQAVGEIK